MIEMLISISLISMLMVSLAGMASTVQHADEYQRGHGEAAQHARVAVHRIGNTVRRAVANEEFPGLWVVEKSLVGWTFPDVLVVWRPPGAALDPDGTPRVNELVVYCPNPGAPNELWELTDPSNSSTVPPITDSAAWLTTIDTMRQSVSSEKVVLTDMLRVATVPEIGSTDDAKRGCVRFVMRLRPSAAQWQQFQSNSLAWEDLDWVQSIYGSTTGLRQTWVRFELQITPGRQFVMNSAEAMPAVPFFGSAAVYYQMDR